MTNREKEKVINNFTKNASSYVTSPIHAKGEDLNALVDWLQPKSNWVVLDVATGAGHVAKTLSPYVKQLFSTDLTKKMLQTAADFLEDYTNIFYMLADAEQLPFLDETFDAVTCRIAPHHFPHPEKFIKEISRVLKPGGMFMLIDNVAPEESAYDEFINAVEKLRDNSHVRALKMSEWNHLLSHNQMRVIKDETRRKTFEFEDWVSRTAHTEAEREAVRKYIIDAEDSIKKYFQVITNGEQIVSFETNVGLLLASKEE